MTKEQGIDIFNLPDLSLEDFTVDFKKLDEGAIIQVFKLCGLGKIEEYPQNLTQEIVEFASFKNDFSSRFSSVRSGDKIVGFTPIKKDIVDLFNPNQLLNSFTEKGLTTDCKGGNLRWGTLSGYFKERELPVGGFYPGAEVRFSALREFPLSISPYLFRLVCANGAILKAEVHSSKLYAQTINGEFSDSVNKCMETAYNQSSVLNEYGNKHLTLPLPNAISEGLSILGFKSFEGKILFERAYAYLEDKTAITLLDVFNSITQHAQSLPLVQRRGLERKVGETITYKACSLCGAKS